MEIVDVQVLAKVAYALYLTESPDLPDVLDMLNSAKKVTPEGINELMVIKIIIRVEM